MALPILDGNQTATTLSTVVSGGAHIPAHTVVSLGAQAITDMRSAVSGSVVSISNLPATQTIAGTVTANVVGESNTNDGTLYPIPVCESGNNDYSGRHIPIGFKNSNLESTIVDNNNPLPIAGTVTANVPNLLINEPAVANGIQIFAFNENQNSSYALRSSDVDVGALKVEPISIPAISGTVTANVGNSVTIGSLPSISGTVTANVANSVTVGSLPVQLSTTTIGGTSRLNVTLSSATTVGATAPSYGNLYGGSDGTNLRAISVDTYGRTISSVINQGFSVITRGFVTIGTDSSVIDISHIPNNAIITCDIEPTGLNTGVYKLQYVSSTASSPVDITVTNSFTSSTTTNISANGSYQFRKSADYSLNYLRVKYVAGIGSIAKYTISLIADPYFALDRPISGTVTANINGTVPVSGTFWQATQPVSGTVTAAVASTTVTVSAMPSGALTTRFGSVTTANTSQITTAVTNASRKYLLAQNISAGTVTIGIGFSPTTTQGIQLTAGAGLTFDSFCPTGAVYWLGATTGATFTILEG